METSMYQKMRVGIVHFKAFPGIETGAGPIVETLEKICADDFWTAVEVGWMKDYRVRNTASHAARPEPSVGGLCDPAQGAVEQVQPELVRRRERSRPWIAIKSASTKQAQLGAEVVRLIAGKDPGRREARAKPRSC